MTANIGWPWNSTLPSAKHRLVVLADRADVVLAGDVRRRQHVDDAGRRAHRVEVDRHDLGMRHGRQAEIGVQRARRLGMSSI